VLGWREAQRRTRFKECAECKVGEWYSSDFFVLFFNLSGVASSSAGGPYFTPGVPWLRNRCFRCAVMCCLQPAVVRMPSRLLRPTQAPLHFFFVYPITTYYYGALAAVAFAIAVAFSISCRLPNLPFGKLAALRIQRTLPLLCHPRRNSLHVTYSQLLKRQ